MRKIDLGKIIEDKKIDRRELAEILYPIHKHPVMAIDRVIKGEMLLDSTQIVQLSVYTGIEIQNLFVETWKSTIKGNLIFWVNGKYRATLDVKTWTTSITVEGVRGIARVFSSPGISLADYVMKLDYEIFKITDKHDEN